MGASRPDHPSASLIRVSIFPSSFFHLYLYYHPCTYSQNTRSIHLFPQPHRAICRQDRPSADPIVIHFIIPSSPRRAPGPPHRPKRGHQAPKWEPPVFLRLPISTQGPTTRSIPTRTRIHRCCHSVVSPLQSRIGPIHLRVSQAVLPNIIYHLPLSQLIKFSPPGQQTHWRTRPLMILPPPREDQGERTETISPLRTIIPHSTTGTKAMSSHPRLSRPCLCRRLSQRHPSARQWRVRR